MGTTIGSRGRKKGIGSVIPTYKGREGVCVTPSAFFSFFLSVLLGIGIRDLGLLLIFLFLMIVMAIARPIYGTSGVYMSVVAVHTLVRYLVWTTVIAIEFSYISRGCAVID